MVAGSGFPPVSGRKKNAAAAAARAREPKVAPGSQGATSTMAPAAAAEMVARRDTKEQAPTPAFLNVWECKKN